MILVIILVAFLLYKIGYEMGRYNQEKEDVEFMNNIKKELEKIIEDHKTKKEESK